MGAGIFWVRLPSARTIVSWLAARYEDDYVKINGTWKFKHLRAFGRMAAPYEEGWASQAKVDVFSNEL